MSWDFVMSIKEFFGKNINISNKNIGTSIRKKNTL